jgi:hypothetical protein
MTTQAQSTGTRLTRKLALASGAVALAAAATNDVQAGIVAAQSTPIRPPVNFSGNSWDVDGDGTFEFQFRHRGFAAAFVSVNWGSIDEVKVAGQGGFGRLLRSPTNLSRLEKLAIGSMIGSSGTFPYTSQVSYYARLTSSGGIGSFASDWSKGETGFFGFAFNKGGQRHYGWGELKFDPTSVSSKGYGFQVTRAYYNDTPGAAITAGDTGGGSAVPEPSTLALAMLAAGGVAAYRSRRKQPAA